jgi:hypothetical protein
VAVLGINIKHDVAMVRQTLLKGASSDPFRKTLAGALKNVGKTTSGSSAGSTSGPAGINEKAIKGKINEAMAVNFIAPMLVDALGRFDQTYFANSPAEQAYSTQLYTEIASRIGQSDKFPIGRDIARAMIQRLKGTAEVNKPSAAAPSSGTSSNAAQATDTQGKASS